MGTISLPVVVGACPQQITKSVNFLGVDCSSSYNAIIGRPTLNSWKAVTSTYHLSVKFPTAWSKASIRRPVSGKRMLPGHVGNGRISSNHEY